MFFFFSIDADKAIPQSSRRQTSEGGREKKSLITFQTAIQQQHTLQSPPKIKKE